MTAVEGVAWATLALGLMANAVLLGRVYGILRSEVDMLKREISEQRQQILIMESRHLSTLDAISSVRADIRELSAVVKMALESLKIQSELIEKLRK